jgi:N-acetylmuramoyl-L-alanine amidase
MKSEERLGLVRALGVTGLAALPLVSATCGAKPAVPDAPSPAASVAIIGPARLSARQLVAWFNGRQPQPAGSYSASVDLATIAQYYVEEGAAENVTGDVAFAQAIVETGWFRFTGTVPASANNFAGIGAADVNPGPATFADARTGVRAHIQHLRAYADPTATACATPPLRNPCVDPRFALVVPKGRAPAWNDLGSGNWATTPHYGQSILSLYNEALAFNGVR